MRIASCGEYQQQTLGARKTAIGKLYKEAFTRLIHMLNSEPAEMQSLKKAVNDLFLTCAHLGLRDTLLTGEGFTALQVQQHIHALRIVDNRLSLWIFVL